MFKQIEKGEFKSPNAREGVFFRAYKGSIHVTWDRKIHEKLGKPRFMQVHIGEGEHQGKFLLAPSRTDMGNCYVVGLNNRQITLSPNKLKLSKEDVIKLTDGQHSHVIMPEGLVFWIGFGDG